MFNAEIKKFIDKCRDKDVEVFEIQNESWRLINNFNLHNIYFAHDIVTVQHNVMSQIFAFDICGVKQIQYGDNKFTTALIITTKDNRFLLHLHK